MGAEGRVSTPRPIRPGANRVRLPAAPADLERMMEAQVPRALTTPSLTRKNWLSHLARFHRKGQEEITG